MLPIRRVRLAVLSAGERISEPAEPIEVRANAPLQLAPALKVKVVICLLLACLGAGWFASHLLLLPQPVSYAPHWHGARWLQATDGGGPVGYFRKVVTLDLIPDSAFISLAADQTFRLYVNGIFVGSNTADLALGGRPRAYIYDITSWLRPGPNVIAIRVVNSDNRAPTVQASLGMVHGRATYYSGTDTTWQATTRSTLAYTYNTPDAPGWTARHFSAASWPAGRQVVLPSLTPQLTVNPLLYEKALQAHWMSAGASHEAYFVRTMVIPDGTTHAWLRLVVDGTASVFINGQLWLVWNGAAPIEHQKVTHYLSFTHKSVRYHSATHVDSGLAMGIYDISPYLHAGNNTLAVHVSSPGKSAALVGLETVGAALAMDVLVTDNAGHTLWMDADRANSGWHVARQPLEGWMWGNRAALAWPAPLSIGRPGANEVLYVPESDSPRNIALLPLAPYALLLLSCVVAIVGLWLFMSLILLRSYFRSHGEALATLSMAYLPALACEVFLIAIARLSLIPAPFPYNWQCSFILLLLTAFSFCALWLYKAFPFFAESTGPCRVAPLEGARVGEFDPHRTTPLEAYRYRFLEFSFGQRRDTGWPGAGGMLVEGPGGGALEDVRGAGCSSPKPGHPQGPHHQDTHPRVPTLPERSMAEGGPAAKPQKPIGALEGDIPENEEEEQENPKIVASASWIVYEESGPVLHPTSRERLLMIVQSQLARLREHWGLLLLLLVAIPLICYNLSYEPYWQDELTSYFAAKGILAHGLPLLPSGFLYPKGELYSYLLALSMALLGEQHGLLRIISVLAYLISLPLFYRVSCVFFDRKIALLATAMLAFSPFTLLWGRAVRMYELAQLLTILVMYLFFQAARQRDRPHLIYLAVAALIATYFSHEEVFIILPALLLGVLVVSRDAAHRLPAILYQKHWWIAAMLGAAVISGQLLIARFTHPPVLGTDQSQQPMIQFTTDNLPYYMKLFFFPQALGNAQAFITINSLLALAGCILAFWPVNLWHATESKSQRCPKSSHPGDPRFDRGCATEGTREGNLSARYCALLFLAALLMLVLGFTPTASRYIYPLLPAFYLLGAYAVFSGLRALFSLAHFTRRIPLRGATIRKYTLLWKGLALFSQLLLCASIVILPMFPAGSYNLLVSRMAGLPYHHHFPDYDASGQYVKQHWRSGDIVVAISPAISVLYYTGRVDYFFSVDRALYLFEHNGHITDTPTGSTPLLSQGDFNALLARRARMWVITDKGLYESSIVKGKRFTFPSDFHLIYAGSGSSVYLRGDD